METMTTNKSKPSVPAPVKPPINTSVLDLATMDGIPVYELTFCVGMNNKPDLPIPDSGGGMGKLRCRPDREITYLPKVLFYRIVQTSRDDKVGTTTFYIPREWAIFQPLE
jgi:hypothetical protein